MLIPNLPMTEKLTEGLLMSVEELSWFGDELGFDDDEEDVFDDDAEESTAWGLKV